MVGGGCDTQGFAEGGLSCPTGFNSGQAFLETSRKEPEGSCPSCVLKNVANSPPSQPSPPPLPGRASASFPRCPGSGAVRRRGRGGR